MNRDEAIITARAICNHGDNITYPSMAAARHVRNVLRVMLWLAEIKPTKSDERIAKILMWLKANADDEHEPKVKLALTEAFSAALAISEGREY